MAAGLAHLHGVGILHRDLKPANVLLDGARAKLADFGYSSAVVGDGADQSVCGTPRWMAPEVVFGRPYSFGADVYSYALILWQLLAWDPKPYLEYGNDMKRFLKALDGDSRGSRPDVEACRRRGAPEVLCAMLDKASQGGEAPTMVVVLDAIDVGARPSRPVGLRPDRQGDGVPHRGLRETSAEHQLSPADAPTLHRLWCRNHNTSARRLQRSKACAGSFCTLLLVAMSSDRRQRGPPVRSHGGCAGSRPTIGIVNHLTAAVWRGGAATS